jgi:hypothetical protein
MLTNAYFFLTCRNNVAGMNPRLQAYQRTSTSAVSASTAQQ